MSHGPGTIERRIGELFGKHQRPFSVAEITDHAFDLNGKSSTRAQRLSATRAAHRLIKRTKETVAKARKLADQARREMEAALGYEFGFGGRKTREQVKRYWEALDANPSHKRAEELFEIANKWGGYLFGGGHPGHEFWRAERGKNGKLYFHPVDAPVRVWAVSIRRAGIIWAEAEVVRITERNVMVRYAGETARLDREKLWRWWAFWRGVRFVSSRDGRIAQALDEAWQHRYGRAGGVPPVMQMPLADAIKLLGVPANYTKEDVEAAFRREAKKAHPDVGGTAGQFRKLVQARDRLLAALGTSAPPPKPPTYAPKGTLFTYRRVSISRQGRLGSSTLRLGRQS
jgi:hypothetical protein